MVLPSAIPRSGQSHNRFSLLITSIVLILFFLGVMFSNFQLVNHMGVGSLLEENIVSENPQQTGSHARKQELLWSVGVADNFTSESANDMAPCSKCLAFVMTNATRFPDNSSVCIVARCGHIYSRAFFHRIHDCAVGYQRLVSIAGHLVAQGSTVSLVVDDRSRGVIEAIIGGWIEPPLRLRIALLSSKESRGVQCVDSASWFDYHINSLVCRKCVLENLLKAAAVPKKTKRSVLFISRKRTRKILVQDLLVRRLTGLAASNGFALTIYRGDESLAQTIRLFHSAAVVVGYHGSGLLNTIFCKNTLVMEVSTYLHPPQFSSRKWRTLKGLVAQWETPLQWLMVWVDHQNLRPRPPTNHSQGMKFDWDHFVKKLDVDLGRANIDTIAEIVGNFLQSLRNKRETK
mmetsp:Transcript_53442/g.127152  ORF Transcript_53442/g.127152 Transcript_53442/m.127152 type:complete len:403 (+) Transcript_53442:333-1541(+)